jgi:two-component system chemotaxis response regulator CheY
MIEKDSPILLVDDSMAMRHTVKNILSASGYTKVQSAGNGIEALQKIRVAIKENRIYKVVFLDWNMPEMDGLAFLKACRGDLGLKNMAIIMLTAVSDQKSVVQALSCGATSYITKPVSAETIMKKLDQVGSWIESRGKKT